MHNISKIAYTTVGTMLLSVLAAGLLLAGRYQTPPPAQSISQSLLISLLILCGSAAVILGISTFLFQQRYRRLLEQSDALGDSNSNLHLYLKAVEQSENSIIITDTEAKILYVNPYFSKLTGYSLDEVYDCNPKILQSGKVKDSLYKDMWRSLNDGRPWKGTLQNRKKNGKLYWEEVTISPIFNGAGEHTNFIAVKEDISERINLIERMQREQEKLQLIVEHSGFGITIISQRRIIWCNQTGLQLFGYSTETDVLGQSTRIFFPDEEAYDDTGRRYVEHFRNSREALRIETLLQKKDGTLFWCAITGKPLDMAYQEKGYTWIIEDITERKANRDALHLAKEEAESANMMKSRMLANIIHDIRTPLHGVMGTFSLLKPTSLQPEQLQMVSGGLKASNYLLSLLNSLLDFSKIEAGQMTIDEHPFRVQDILTELENIFSSQFEEKGITCTCRIAEDLPEILIGDSMRIKQILVNLIGNSLKFTEQGSITVDLQGDQGGEERIQLRCHVQDSGIGIPKEKQEGLFEAFTQADSSISRDYGGSGLGLSISKQLCTLMGGDIWFESAAGEGTTFSFTLLCGVGSEQELEEKPDIKSSAKVEKNRPMNILLVDDDKGNLELLRMMLKDGGHTTTAASNGWQALETILTTPFDVIFMDMQMPVMDGMTTTQIIRACESDSGPGRELDEFSNIAIPLHKAISGTHIPIIALTGIEMKEDIQRCKDAGVDDIIIKPFLPRQLQEILAKL
ncbi:MAG: PAS domain S-box protein [Thermodesulfobacteriota bacterium]